MKLIKEVQRMVHSDSRGEFFENFNIQDQLDLFNPVQINCSRSSMGAIRGIHYSLSTAGQAKLVTCVSGKILDVVVDLREGSETFGRFETAHLSAFDGKMIYVAPGLGHGFMALEENTIVTYQLSSPYNPNLEFAINPFDATLKLPWPDAPYIISEKDSNGMSLLEAQNKDLLPKHVANPLGLAAN